MASLLSADVPVALEDYEAAKERQRYLIDQMEALDMTLWLARIPSDTKFQYSGMLQRTDDDNMETEILDIMREIESLQEVVDVFEDVDDDADFQVDEEALREFEAMMKGRKATLTFPIPEACLSRNPSPCSMAWAPRTITIEQPFNPFREEFYLGLEETITDDTEFVPVPRRSPLSISTIPHKSLLGDLVEYVKEWNPFDIGSTDSSRSCSMDSMFSLNEVASDSSISSDADDGCFSRKTSQEAQKTITAPLLLEDGTFGGITTRTSSFSSHCPWPEYLEYDEMDLDDDIDYDDYYEYEEIAHQALLETTAKYAGLGSSLPNQIICTERELSRSSLSSCSDSDSSSISESEAHTPIESSVIHIELPALKVDYYLSFNEAQDEPIRTKLLDSTVDLQEQFPSFESVLSNVDSMFELALEDPQPPALSKSMLLPPTILQARPSLETIRLDELADTPGSAARVS
ncbi:hypothetical protein Dda_1470 [Drechslerella dactyloides]|uniref:Uncharacterized protein n=1 Tax=Drechslerella dactyloides TaxID=74499 RepID=A0AAD6NLU5_DREDA|nr:hypothetical protein Dda_1470 [Drechslerella dactyloides]